MWCMHNTKHRECAAIQHVPACSCLIWQLQVFCFATYSLLYMTMLVGERRVFTSIRPNLFVARPQQWRRSWWVPRKLVTK